MTAAAIAASLPGGLLKLSDPRGACPTSGLSRSDLDKHHTAASAQETAAPSALRCPVCLKVLGTAEQEQGGAQRHPQEGCSVPCRATSKTRSPRFQMDFHASALKSGPSHQEGHSLPAPWLPRSRELVPAGSRS